ncbi:MAG: hypothetical protein FJY76_01840 [Candidatus Aenigmarchaeota archaeon]|nr:hypothetical protein [Candidatus Aenigmarchaeota archaeon]
MREMMNKEDAFLVADITVIAVIPIIFVIAATTMSYEQQLRTMTPLGVVWLGAIIGLITQFSPKELMEKIKGHHNVRKPD